MSLTYKKPFVKRVNHSCPVAIAVSVETNTTYAAAHAPPSGMERRMSYVDGMRKATSKSLQAYLPVSNSVQTGSVPMAAQAGNTAKSIDALAARAPITVLTDALRDSRERISTPLKAEAWRDEITRLRLTHKYPTLANSIQFGFNVGVPPITHTFTPPNKLDSQQHKEAFELIKNNEIAAGRWLGPFSREDIEMVLGPFQSSPIAMVDKPGKPGKFRLVQNLSYPHKPVYIPSIGTTISSINSHIDSSLYPCFWGTYANTCRLIWTLPPNSQGAVRDISEAYRSIPLHPSQWPGLIVRTSEQEFCVDTRDMFGLSSSGGAFGHSADAGMEISRGHGLGPLTKWVDDYLWFRVL